MGGLFRRRGHGKLPGRRGSDRCRWKRQAAIVLLLAAGLSLGTGGPQGTAWSQITARVRTTAWAQKTACVQKTAWGRKTTWVQATARVQKTDLPGWPEKKRFFLQPTLDLPVSEVRTSLVTAEDSIPNDTLFQLLSPEGFPVAYYRKINTDVCFDGKCRMLRVRLYWNITGRYLGIELPEKEFLSKSDHEPFNLNEYARMNALLADPFSPLANFAFEDLVPSQGIPGADAVTAATAPAMLDYVVEGAAYTTYRLWHFVYGPTRAEVVRLTEKLLSPELLAMILESPDRSDVSWALQRLQAYAREAPELLPAAAELLGDEDYSLSLQILDAFGPDDLMSPGLQRVLFDKYTVAGYSLKNAIVDLLQDAPGLEPEVAAGLAGTLPEANGALLGGLLELFREQGVTDVTVLRTISGLLDNENNFTARKAYEFLRQAKVTDELVLERMEGYRPRGR